MRTELHVSTSRPPHRLLAVVASAALVAGLAGCEEEVEPTGGVAFVVGARSNMPAPQLDGRALQVLDTAVADQSRVSITVADGEPSLVEPGAIDLLVDGGTSQARDVGRTENRQRVLDGLASARADDEETDLLKALDLGARSIESAPGERTVVIVDSGLSTVSPLDFRQPGLLDADPETLAGDLAEAGYLPDLEGVTVVLQGIGDTFAPQAPLDLPQRTNLIAIWEAIIRAASAAEVVVERTPLTDSPADGLPRVTPIPVPAPGTGDVPEPCTVTLLNESVRFEPDSADFVDADEAGRVLAPLAQQLAQPGVSATVTGTTADVGDIDGQIELSLRRAQAVRALLVELGARPDSMTAIGLGSDFPGYVEDHDADGRLLEDKAEQNRKVVVQIVGGTCDRPSAES